MVDKLNLLKSLDNVTLIINFNGRINWVNKKAKEMLETENKNLLGSNFFSFFSTTDQNKINKELKDLKNNNIINLKDIILKEINSGRIDLILDLLTGVEKDLIKVMIIKSKDRENLKNKINIPTDFPEKNPNPVLKVNPKGNILYANQASENLLTELGVSEEDAVPNKYQDTIDQVLETKENQELMVQLDEEIYLFSFAYSEKDHCIYLYGQDMTGLKQANEHIERLANYDSLSGLPNRNLFLDRLERLIIKSEEHKELISVLFIDIDNFKKINDTFGHKVGDKLLTDVATKLENCLEKSDTLARLNGDQFGIIINGMKDLTRLNLVIEKILTTFKNPFIVYPDPFTSEGKEVFVTISIGASIYPQDSKEVDQLIKKAEIAMHQVKKSGKDNYRFYSKEMNESFLNELELEAKLRRALDKDEFIVYYQPQINIKENEVSGLEALIRWDNQDLGLVSPGKFIPLAERTGLILEIGSWVLCQACKEVKAIQEQTEKDLTIGVNLSPRQFKDEELIKKVDYALAESGLAPGDLTLEITESIIMEDINKSVEILVELKERGINISVDDFGTGYSSLNYLSSFPLDELKIDRSFIMDIPEDKEKISISKAIINLAHALNLGVIAEGAEIYQQIKFLKENDCEKIQGYYYSKPVPQKDILHFLEDKNEFKEGN